MTIFKDFWTVETAAKELGICSQTVRAMIHNGSIDSVLIGSGYLLSQQAIDSFVESMNKGTSIRN